MLSITTKSPYALSALVELYRLRDACPVPIAELARRREIPVQFLEQLFATLRRAGVLRSQRGVKGGYSFARPADEVTVLELVELLDGPLGRGAQGIFSEAAQAARCGARRSNDGLDGRAGELRAAGADVPHLAAHRPAWVFPRRHWGFRCRGTAQNRSNGRLTVAQLSRTV